MTKRAPMDAGLLVPSLSGDGGEQPKGIYSLRALMLTSFFGGPFAALLMTTLNSSKLKRAGRDAPYLVLGLVVTVALIKLLHGSSAGASIFPSVGPSAPRLLVRAFSLTLFAGAYVLHRPAYRALRFTGQPAANALPVGLACVAFGMVVLGAVIRLVQI